MTVAAVIADILKGAIAELLGGIATELLSEPTKALLQKFKLLQSQPQKDFDEALSRVMANIEKQYGQQARAVLFFDAIGQNAQRRETKELFAAATNAYLFQNIWSRHHLPELLSKFTQACGGALPNYDWPQADTDLADFFRRLEAELMHSSSDWRDLFSHYRLREISLAAFNISGDTAQMVKHLEALAARLAPPPPDLHGLRQIYLNHLKNRFGELDFRGIAQVKNIVKLPLRRIFVPLSGELESEREREARENQPELETLARLQAEKERRAPLQQLVRENPYLVILGDPGSGKSTTLKYIALLFAEGEAEARLNLESRNAGLPIFLPISAYAQALAANAVALQTFLPQYYREHFNLPELGPLFNHAFENNYALVLLDGLDEVRNWETRLAILRRVENDLLKRYPHNRFIFTSRIAGYDRAPLGAPFRQCTVLPFDDDEVRRFARQWSLAFEMTAKSAAEAETPARQRAENLLEAIFATPEVRRLAANPLMVTILALIHHQNVRLPERRVELYKLCVQALAETWNKMRTESATGRPLDLYLGNQRLDERFVVEALGPVALWMHETAAGATLERPDLRDKIAEYLPAEADLAVSRKHAADDFLQIMVEGCGLLQEKGENLFGFMHLTFEEYLAGRALRESEHVNLDAWLREHWFRENWKEVIRLAVGDAGSRQASDMLEKILAMPDGSFPGLQAVLAAECLLDLKFSVKAQPKVVQAVLHLFDCREIAANIRIAASGTLGRIGDPRDLEEFVEVPVGEFPLGVTEEELAWFKKEYRQEWLKHSSPQHLITLPAFAIGKYPVVNRSFREFVTSRGYDDPQWWNFSEKAEAFRRSLEEKCPKYWHDSKWNGGNAPVVGVSWFEAVAFCRWLTRKWRDEGKLGANESVRLPTEAEWEKAASWDWCQQHKRRFPWGDEYDGALINAENKIGRTSPVGVYPNDSPCGARDMAGNVWEWCQTAWRKYRYQVDAHEQLTGNQRRVLRGGAWDVLPQDVACAIRDGYVPDERSYVFGFRCART